MYTKIRAKFRCLSVKKTWEDRAICELRPVIPGNKEDPSNAENRTFWRYTPNGEAELTFRTSDEPFTPAAYYYVDFEPDETGIWKLESLTQNETQLDVAFSHRWNVEGPLFWGRLKMMIDNQDAWPAFLGKVATTWAVTFTPAT